MLGADLGSRAVSRYRQQDDDDGRRGEQTTAPWPRVGAGRTGPGMAFLLPSPAVTTGSRVRAMVAVELLPCLCGTRKLLRTDAAGVRFGCQPWRGSMDRARACAVAAAPQWGPPPRGFRSSISMRTTREARPPGEPWNRHSFPCHFPPARGSCLQLWPCPRRVHLGDLPWS